MNINLHIELLILEGLSIGARDSALVQAAVGVELSRRLTQQGIPKDLPTGGSQARLSAPALPLNSSPDAKVLGAHIGAGVYSAIAGGDRQGHSHG